MLVHEYRVQGGLGVGDSRHSGWMRHDLCMKSRVHPKYKTKYRASNWAEYDRALVQRGDITLWISPNAIAAWKLYVVE